MRLKEKKVSATTKKSDGDDDDAARRDGDDDIHAGSFWSMQATAITAITIALFLSSYEGSLALSHNGPHFGNSFAKSYSPPQPSSKSWTSNTSTCANAAAPTCITEHYHFGVVIAGWAKRNQLERANDLLRIFENLYLTQNKK